MMISNREAIKSSVQAATVPTNDFITRITWVLHKKVAGKKNIVKSNRDEIWTTMVYLWIKLIGSSIMSIQELLESFIFIGYGQHGKVLKPFLLNSLRRLQFCFIE